MRDLIAMFVDEMPEKVATLESLARSRDSDSLRRLAQQLKGASGGYGFSTVGAAAAVLEESLKTV
jgi:HPt (histidine-containing phosphotransfer) domain-containing protein